MKNHLIGPYTPILIAYCPICGYGPFEEPYTSVMDIRGSSDICACCGCEYNYDDTEQHFDFWKNDCAMEWFDESEKPEAWDPEEQFTHIIRPWPPCKLPTLPSSPPIAL